MKKTGKKYFSQKNHNADNLDSKACFTTHNNMKHYHKLTNHKKTMTKYNLLPIFLFIICLPVFGQQSINSAGGEAISSSGNISYSVGQTFYLQSDNNSGSITEGVQQTYRIEEIQQSSTIETANINIEVFPNPTTDYITLQNKSNLSDLSYLLLDTKGVKISNGNIKRIRTEVDLSSCVQSVYLLLISDYERTIKTFRIIKQ